MGHPAEGQQRVRSRHGRRAGSLYAAARSRLSAGLPRRDLKATDRRDARAHRDETGRPARFDYEYERNGTANLFMIFAPLEGWRHVKVTDRHTAVDYAHVVKDLADVHFADARTISTSIAGPHSTTPFLPPKPDGWSSASTLHAKARKLARSGRIRARRSIVPMPRPPHPRQANSQRRNRRLAARPQRQSRQSQLVLHNPKCSNQTQPPIPCNLTESAD
jgi:hypothetical protein